MIPWDSTWGSPGVNTCFIRSVRFLRFNVKFVVIFRNVYYIFSQLYVATHLQQGRQRVCYRLIPNFPRIQQKMRNKGRINYSAGHVHSPISYFSMRHILISVIGPDLERNDNMNSLIVWGHIRIFFNIFNIYSVNQKIFKSNCLYIRFS